MYEQYHDYIESTYGYLSEGDSAAGQRCPACGGHSNRGTFSVSRRDGNLLWVCHRDSCSIRGVTTGSYRRGNSKVTTTVRPDTRGVVGKQFLRTAESLPDEVANDLLTRYSIGPSHVGRFRVGWDNESARLVLPVFSRSGDELGCVLRSLTGALPKTLSHTEQGAMAWFTNAKQGGIIIVEDQLSAIRASDYLTSVALLGTNLSEDRVEEIRKAGGPVYLALDSDAFPKAIQHVIKYKTRLPMKLVSLRKDIKDMTDEEASDLFAGLCNKRMR